MIVELDSSLFQDALKFQKLNHLFVFFEEGKHKLYLREDISGSQWLLLNNHLRAFCEAAYKDSIYVPRKNVQLVINQQNNIASKIYSLEDGYIYLQNNLIIFVENATSDRLFLNSIFKNFMPECENINNAFRKRWIELIGPGGKNEIKKAINNELRKFRSEKSSNDIYLRAIVIIDSDKKYPNDNIGNAQNEIDIYCKEKNIICHILSKREIENYVPFEAFFDLDYPIVQEYKKLSNNQSSFYDLEKGFDNKNLNTLEEQVQILFEGIGQRQEGILRRGFNSIQNYNPKRDIPSLFNHKHTSRETLLKKSGDNELINIVNKINELL